MSKKETADEDETPTVVNYREKHSRKMHRKSVPFKHLDNPPHRLRTLMGYLVIAAVAFWLLHFVLHVG